MISLIFASVSVRQVLSLFIAGCVSVCCGDPLPVEGDEEFSS